MIVCDSEYGLIKLLYVDSQMCISLTLDHVFTFNQKAIISDTERGNFRFMLAIIDRI